MSCCRRPAVLSLLAVCLAAWPVLAQTTPPAASTTEPAAPPAAPAPVVPPAAAPGSDVQALTPPPADPTLSDEVDLPARPVGILRGSANWDVAYETLQKSFARLAGDLAKAGIKVTGKPIAIFTETDDTSFRFEALLPIEAAPASRPDGLPADIQFGTTPSGKATRFVHQAPYEEIDGTYEAITAYLDSKDVEVKDAFIEEYVAMGKDDADPSTQVYIYVQPK
jgi:effector-binding domain-containing protein